MTSISSSSRLFRSIALFVVLLTVTLLGSTVYRPYVYSHHINDGHLADFWPNLMSIPVGYAFMRVFYVYRKKEIGQPYRKILTGTAGVLLYESLQLLSGGFDLLDIVATFVGASATAAVLYVRGVRWE